MPLYVYECSRCDAVAEVQRKIEERDEPLLCGDCNMKPTLLAPIYMKRVPTMPAGHFPGASSG